MALHKSADKVIGGVCGGISEALGIDKTLGRVIYVILTFGTAFSGVLVYLLLWLIMPEK